MTIRAETNDECNNGLQSCWTQCHALPEVARPPVMLEIENPSWLLGECRFWVAPGDYRVALPCRHDTEQAMKYLCLVYYDEKTLDALSKSEYDALASEALAYDEEMRKSGHLIVAQPLQPVQSATTLRPRMGKMCITDGPFAETKEQLGGFVLIDAKDLKDAVEVASKIPPARLGCIEVRPIKELSPQ